MKILMILLGAAVVTTGCAVGPSTDECPDPPITKVNIHFKKNSEIRVVPPNAKPHLRNVLEFKLHGDEGTQVTVEGKDGESSWIKGSNSGDSIFVCVKNDLIVDRTYTYKVTVDGVGVLDPEVTVRD
jgi:hypothetical protein